MKVFFTLILFFQVYFCFADSEKVVYRNDLDKHKDAVNWINENTSILDSSDGNHFSRTDSLQTYSFGLKENFPEQFFGSGIYVVVECKVRSTKNNAAFAIAILEGDSQIIWDSKDLIYVGSNSWKNNRQAFFIPGNFVNVKNTLMVYAWNKDVKFICDFDDLEISIGRLAYQTKLAFANTHMVPFDISAIEFKESHIMFKGEHLVTQIDTVARQFKLLTSDNDSLIHDLKICIEFNDLKHSKSHYNPADIIIRPDSINFSGSSERNTIVLLYHNEFAIINVKIVIDNLSGSFSAKANIQFTKQAVIKRAAMVFRFGVDPIQVVKNNTDIQRITDGREYWIKDGHIVYETGKDKWITDRSYDRSSMQLAGKDLYVNIDYSEDHPAIYFPLLKKSLTQSEDHSKKTYLKGSEISGSIGWNRIDSSQKLVRVLKNPDGFLSSIVWTEHADFSDIRTQRALMFGSEFIHNIDSAIGGFAGNGIPLTKSVFYDNPTREKLSVKDARFQGYSLSIKQSPEFLLLLKQMNEKGSEICLHSPDPFTTNRILADEAMNFMQNNFNSVNWIDHGYDNSKQSNREDVNCDGLDSTSKYYMGDLFKKYGIKYLWSSFYEDYSTFENDNFYSFLTTPYSGWDEPVPAPEYFRNPKDPDFISWRTTFTLDPPDGSMWKYYFDDVRLNDLVQSKGNCILHCYLSRIDPENAFYIYSSDTIVINPEFNEVLKKLKKYQDEKKIWLTTVERLLNYRLQLENVKIQYLKNNRVVVYNDNQSTVKGLSVISDSENISAGEKNIRLKKVGGETVAIFDLFPKEKLILDLR